MIGRKIKKMEDMDLGCKGSKLKEFDTEKAFGEKGFKKSKFLKRM